MVQGEQFVTKTARIAIDHNGVFPPIGHTRQYSITQLFIIYA